MFLSVSSLKLTFDFDDDSVTKYEVRGVCMIRGGFHVFDAGLLVADWFMLCNIKCYFVFQSASVSCSGFLIEN